MQLELCKNCENTTEGNFCSNCGQKRHTVRLDWHYIREEIKYTFLHINKGLLYTSKQLLTRPGKTVKEFIEGKRIQHYKPILFVFVLAGINGLLNHYLPMEEVLKAMAGGNKTPSKAPFSPNDVFNFITNHYAVVELLFLPIISFCSWLAFKKWGYNYVENIIINCYGSGLRLVFGILVFPIHYLVCRTSAFLPITTFLGFISIALTVWLYLELYKGRPLKFIILRILLMGFYFLLSYLLMIIVTILVFVIKYKMNT